MEKRPGRVVSRLMAVVLLSSSLLPLAEPTAAQSNSSDDTMQLIGDEDQNQAPIPAPIVSGAVSNVPVETYPGLMTYSGIIQYHRSEETEYDIDGIVLGRLFKYTQKERTYDDAVIEWNSGVAKITTSMYDHIEDDLDVCSFDGLFDHAQSFTGDTTTVQKDEGAGKVRIEEPYWSHGNSIDYRYDLAFDSILEQDYILHLRTAKINHGTGDCKVDESKHEYTIEGKRVRYRFSLQGIREPDGSIRGRSAWPGSNFVETVPGPDYENVSQFSIWLNEYAQTLGAKKKKLILHEVTWDLKPNAVEPIPGNIPLDDVDMDPTEEGGFGGTSSTEEGAP